MRYKLCLIEKTLLYHKADNSDLLCLFSANEKRLGSRNVKDVFLIQSISKRVSNIFLNFLSTAIMVNKSVLLTELKTSDVQ